MIITISWLKEHLQTKASETKIINQLTNIGLEVESIKENSGELSDFGFDPLDVPTNYRGLSK